MRQVQSSLRAEDPDFTQLLESLPASAVVARSFEPEEDLDISLADSQRLTLVLISTVLESPRGSNDALPIR